MLSAAVGALALLYVAGLLLGDGPWWWYWSGCRCCRRPRWCCAGSPASNGSEPAGCWARRSPSASTPLTGTLGERLRGVVNHSATYRDAGLAAGAGVRRACSSALIVVSYWLAIPILLSVPFWWWAVPADDAYNVVTLLPWPTAPEGQGLLLNNILIDSSPGPYSSRRSWPPPSPPCWPW